MSELLKSFKNGGCMEVGLFEQIKQSDLNQSFVTIGIKKQWLKKGTNQEKCVQIHFTKEEAVKLIELLNLAKNEHDKLTTQQSQK